MCGQYLFIQKIGDYFHADTDLRVIRSVIGEQDPSQGDLFPVIRFWVSGDADFIPDHAHRNDAVPTMGAKENSNPCNYRFYILGFPGKSNLFTYIEHAECIVPDGENGAFLAENKIAPRHLTWKFFEKHVIGRYLFWTKHMDIFK